jgi:hypothetical protein
LTQVCQPSGSWWYCKAWSSLSGVCFNVDIMDGISKKKSTIDLIM